MRYTEHLRLSIRHDYYADEICPDFTARPTEASERTLRNHRAVLEPLRDGFRVSIATGDDGAPLIGFDADDKLHFQLLLDNKEFPWFTDLAQLSKLSSPLFVSGDGDDEVLEPVAGEQQALTDVFATLRLDRLDESVASGYFPKIHFKSRSLPWVYYCSTDLPAERQLAVVDTATSEPVIFEQSSLQDDGIADLLAWRYPRRRVVRFASAQPLASRQRPGQSFELHVDGERWTGPLPLPAANQLEQHPSVPGGEFLFQIVTALQQTIPTMENPEPCPPTRPPEYTPRRSRRSPRR